jgi:hypothetical protein
VVVLVDHCVCTYLYYVQKVCCLASLLRFLGDKVWVTEEVGMHNFVQNGEVQEVRLAKNASAVLPFAYEF